MSDPIASAADIDPARWSFDTEQVTAGQTPDRTTGVLPVYRTISKANIGDVRSLVIQPASATHSQRTPEAQPGSGVTPRLVRLAANIEGNDGILTDRHAGFAAAAT